MSRQLLTMRNAVKAAALLSAAPGITLSKSPLYGNRFTLVSEGALPDVLLPSPGVSSTIHPDSGDVTLESILSMSTPLTDSPRDFVPSQADRVKAKLLHKVGTIQRELDAEEELVQLEKGLVTFEQVSLSSTPSQMAKSTPSFAGLPPPLGERFRPVSTFYEPVQLRSSEYWAKRQKEEELYQRIVERERAYNESQILAADALNVAVREKGERKRAIELVQKLVADKWLEVRELSSGNFVRITKIEDIEKLSFAEIKEKLEELKKRLVQQYHSLEDQGRLVIDGGRAPEKQSVEELALNLKAFFPHGLPPNRLVRAQFMH